MLLRSLAPVIPPIVSKRWRRITFIPTSWPKFVGAREINDLYDESPLEDRLWEEFKRLGIEVERQESVKVNGRNYALDFAIYCMEGKLNVETDGDLWHSDRERIDHDNVRSNDLRMHGWRLPRFSTRQIQEQMGEYCLPTITDMVASLGGIAEEKM